MAVWHPDATRKPYADAGPFVKAGAKIVWHTTEGSSLPNYGTGAAPHFTLNPKTGSLWQHIPVNRSAKSLEHPAGTVETNHANCIQIELVGFASQTQTWPQGYYDRIAKLARWIEQNAGVKPQCSVTFVGNTQTSRRMSDVKWLTYEGHCGHQHVPNNHHWDPGAFKIELILGPTADVSKAQSLLDRIRARARRFGWTKARRVRARQLKRQIAALLGR